MRPITRETILDRRQPSLRWTAVLAGAAVAVALWVVLQLIGMGAGLTAVDLDDSGSLRNVGMGTRAGVGVPALISPSGSARVPATGRPFASNVDPSSNVSCVRHMAHIPAAKWG